MLVIGGPAANDVDRKLADRLGCRHVRAVSKLFPDGESYIRVPVDVSGEDLILVQSLFQPQDKHIFELLLLLETLKDLGARSITAVVPYMAYSRQDRRFLEGEAISVQVLLKHIWLAGASRLITVEIHKEEALRSFPGEAINARPYRHMAPVVQELARDPLVVAPDAGALARAAMLADCIGAEYDHLEKLRDRQTGKIRLRPKRLPVQGRDVVIVDDIVSTGGTVAEASKHIIAQGARKVIVAAAHLLLVGDALVKLKSAGVEAIVGTDTVPVPPGVKVVSSADVIMQYLPKCTV